MFGETVDIVAAGLLNHEVEIDALILVAVVVSIITIRSHTSVK